MQDPSFRGSTLPEFAFRPSTTLRYSMLCWASSLSISVLNGFRILCNQLCTMTALEESSMFVASIGDIHHKHEDLHCLGFQAPGHSSFQQALADIKKRVEHLPTRLWGHGDVQWRILKRTQRGSHRKTPIVH